MNRKKLMMLSLLGLSGVFSMGMLGVIGYAVCVQGRALNFDADFGNFGRVNINVPEKRNQDKS